MENSPILENIEDDDLGTTAYQIQNNIGRSFIDRIWDEYRNVDDFDEQVYIKNKIAYALFGPPQEELPPVASPDSGQGSSTSNSSTSSESSSVADENLLGYSDPQKKIVLLIYQKIKSFNRFSPGQNNICMSVLFVCVVPIQKLTSPDDDMCYVYSHFLSKDIKIFPLFKVRKCISHDNASPSCCVYIDEHCREYESWDAYLSNNKLPDGILIFPKDGVYKNTWPSSNEEDDVIVEIQAILSPESRISSKVKKGVNAVGTGLGLGSLAVIGGALFFPIAGPVLLGATVAGVASGAIGIGSSSTVLADRKKHKQSINLLDAEARNCWLNLAGSSLGIVAGGMGQYLTTAAAQGRVIGNGVRSVCTATFFATAITNGIGIGNNAYSMFVNYREYNSTPSPLEVLQLTTSIFFFAHSVVNLRTANAIIEETQNSVLNQQRNDLSSNNKRKMYDKMAKETIRTAGDAELGRAQIIRSMNHIDNKDAFFSNVRQINKDLNSNGVKISFGDNGQAVLNANMPVNPENLASMPSGERATFFSNAGRSTLNAKNVSTVTSGPGNQSGAINISITNASARLLCDFIMSNDSARDFIMRNAVDLIDDNFERLMQIAKDLIANLSPELNEKLRSIFYNCDLETIKFVFRILKNTCPNNFTAAVDAFFNIEKKIIKRQAEELLEVFVDWINARFSDQSNRATQIHCTICSGFRYSQD